MDWPFTHYRNIFIKLTWVFHLAVSVSFLSAQTPEADQLREDLARINDVEETIDLRNELAAKLLYRFPQQSLIEAQKADSLAQVNQYPEGKGWAQLQIGAAYWVLGDIESAFSHFQTALDTAESHDLIDLKARAHSNFGVVYNKIGDQAASIKAYRDALIIFEQSHNRVRIGVTYNNIGKSYLDSENLDSALFYLNLSLPVARGEAKSLLPINLLNLADVHYRKGQYEQAEALFTEIESLPQAKEDVRSLALTNALRASIQLKKQSPQAALTLAQKAFAQAEESKNLRLLYFTAKILAEAEEANADSAQAYKHYRLYTKLKDSLVSDQNRQRIWLMNQQQDQRLKENSLALAKAEEAKSRLLIYGLCAVMGVMFLLGFVLFQRQNSQRVHNELLAAQNQLVQKEKHFLSRETSELKEINFVKDRLLVLLSHDLRSPLRNLKELLEMTLEDNLSDKEFKKFVPELIKRLDQNSSMMDQLLVWAETQMEGVRMDLVSVPVKPLVEEKLVLFEESIRSKNLVIEVEIPEDFHACADRQMLEVIFQNLIGNAVKFCREGDSIFIGAQHLPEQGLSRFWVKDSGVGISTEDQQKLFGKDTFSTRGTRNERGTGLGLRICSDFVTLMDGRIWAESTPKVGSTFSFELPHQVTS